VRILLLDRVVLNGDDLVDAAESHTNGDKESSSFSEPLAPAMLLLVKFLLHR
jgi:hypothetical protein